MKERRESIDHIMRRMNEMISSGYRSKRLNRLVGGVPSSQHLKGEAADCVADDANELLQALQRSILSFDQAILYRKRNFLHLSLKRDGENRFQVIKEE